MKQLKTVKGIGNIMYKVYFKVFDVLFDVLFGSFNVNSMMSMYCDEDYKKKSQQA
jgi:hypothetical protein